MKKQRMTKQELVDFINSQAMKIKNELNEEFKSVGDPLKVKMGHEAKPSDKDQALVMKSKSSTEYKKGPAEKGEIPLDVEMNEQPSGDGSDKDISTAVYVKAGAQKGGNTPTKGQHKANFDSKTEGPKKSVSDPFLEKGKDKMNTMDKAQDHGAKTYVEAGSEMKVNDPRSGMHKGKFSERVPKSDKDERIAHGIELKESYTKEEFSKFIMEEANKLAKKIILKREFNKLKNDLNHF